MTAGPGGPACPGCAAVDWAPWHDVRGTDGQPHRYGRCRRCGLGHLLTAPSPAELAGWYDEGYFRAGGGRGGYADYAAEAAVHRANARDRMDRVEAARGNHCPATESTHRPVFLEIGCATGETLDEAWARGWTTYGVELSDWAADQARARGHRVVRTLAELDGPDGVVQVDAVGLFQVLEHLPDPAATLRAVTARLRPGGVVVCETWDSASRVARTFGRRWQQLSAPSVLWVLDPGSGDRLLRRAGLAPQSWRATTKRIGLGTVLGQVFGRAGGSGRAAAAARNRSVARLVARLGSTRLTYRGGDLVTFVAHRDGWPRDRPGQSPADGTGSE